MPSTGYVGSWSELQPERLGSIIAARKMAISGWNVDLTRLLLKLIEFNPALHLAWRLLDTRRTAIVAITDLAKRYSINSICDRFCTAVGENKVTGPRMPAAKSED